MDRESEEIEARKVNYIRKREEVWNRLEVAIVCEEHLR